MKPDAANTKYDARGPYKLEIEVHKAEGYEGWRSIYLVISTNDNQTVETRRRKDGVWNQLFTLTTETPPILEFTLYKVRHFHRNRPVVTIPGYQLEDGYTTAAMRKKINSDANPNINIDVSLTLHPIGSSDIQISTDSDLPTPMQNLQVVLDHIHLFINVATPIAELVPFGKTAVDVINGLLNILSIPGDRNQSILSLLATVRQTYDFLKEHEKALQAHEEGKKRIVFLVKQTIECAHFIREYSQQTVFKKWFTSPDTIIQGFQEQFAMLQTTWSITTSLDIKLLTYRALEKVEEIGEFLVLDKMPRLADASYDPDNCCWPGTRTGVINEIDEWIQSAASPGIRSPGKTDHRLCVLHGQAGRGKTSIANFISQKYAETFDQLDLSFGFRDRIERRNLFSTLSRNLADRSRLFRRELLALIHENTQRRESTKTSIQFQLLVDAMAGLSIFGPLVVVIDALDEADKPERDRLLSIFFSRLQELPENFRILVTTRLTEDIAQRIDVAKNVKIINLDTVNSPIIANDIRTFVTGRLAGRGGGLDEHEVVERIVDKAGEVFLVASVLCKTFIDPEGQTRDQLLSDLGGGGNLDNLYESFLTGAFKFDKDISKQSNARANFGRVMCMVLAADVDRPLTRGILEALCSDKNGEPDGAIKAILPKMRPLLNGIQDFDKPLIPFHVSFHEFLIANQSIYQISLPAAHRRLALACLRCMNDRLKFNMCSIPVSSLRNQDQSTLIKANFSSYFDDILEYSCMSWAFHVNGSVSDTNLKQAIRSFLENKILFWFEALSLLGKVSDGVYMLHKLTEWLGDDSLSPLARDALQFLHHFSLIVTESVPHIYLSALHFAPKTSLLRERYLRRYSGIHSVVHSQENWWYGKKRLGRHLGSVTAVAYADDSRFWITNDRVASGSVDGTLRIWDTSTGDPVLFEGHSGSITGVAFSPDGNHLVSGSTDGTVRIWDIDNQESTVFEGHSNSVTAVAFSPNGLKIASSSADSTVRIWNIESPDVVQKLSHSGGVAAFAFSPDGTKIVSCSGDTTLRVWDLETSKHVKLDGHSDTIISVAYSPDGEKVVSASADTTLRIWAVGTRRPADTVTVRNDETRKSIVLKGHSDGVTAVAFSPDGKSLVSGSMDETLRLWDLTKEEPTSILFESEAGRVNAVAFSPNGSRVVSGSDGLESLKILEVLWQDYHLLARSSSDTLTLWNEPQSDHDQLPNLSEKVDNAFVSPDGNTIVFSSGKCWKMWDLGEQQSYVFEGLSESTATVVFSPDGKAILGSEPKILRFWDTESKLFTSLQGVENGVVDIAISFDRRSVICALMSGKIQLWDEVTPTQEPIFFGTTSTNEDLIAISFSKSGKEIISCSDEGDLTIWDTKTQEIRAQLSCPDVKHGIRAVAFSPDRKKVSASFDDGSLVVWDLDARSSTLVGSHSDWVRCLSFSPDGMKFASGSDDGSLRVWTLSDGEFVALEHSDWVMALAFSPDGQRIASISDDETVWVWDIGTKTSVVLEGQRRRARRVAFSPDGNMAMSFSLDGSLRAWNIPVGSPALTSDSSRVPLSAWSGITLKGTRNSVREDISAILCVPSRYASGFQYCHQIAIQGLPVVTRVESHPDFIRDPTVWTKCYVESG